MTPEVQRIQKRIRLGRPVSSNKTTVTQARYKDQRITFCTDMKHDPIQRNHRKGRFYEQSDLELLKDVFTPGGTFIDIGANVGNHSLFAAMVLGATRVVPFEPNPKAYRLLVQNVLANRLEDTIDLSRLGVGLSNETSGGFKMQSRERNLGAAKIEKEAGGALQVFVADDLLAEETPEMIKIDVEGMELSVLKGLEATINRTQPTLMVEVDIENEDAFQSWLKDQGYGITSTVQRYKQNRNHIARPMV